MSRRTKRTAELEAQAAAHRAALAQAISGLTQSTRPTAVLGTDLAQTAMKTALKTARANPLATVLVGAGLAMIFAKSSRSKPPQPQAAAAPSEPQSAEAMRLSLHEGLSHLPPEARKRVIRKRIEALEAQEEVEKRPTTPLALARENKLTLLLAAASLGFAARQLWPKKALKAQETRDQRLRAADNQLSVEEARLQPFPSGPKPTHRYDNQDRI